MNEDIINQSQNTGNNSSQIPDTQGQIDDTDTGDSGERMFEITPDLNISLVKDGHEEKIPPPTPIPNAPSTPVPTPPPTHFTSVPAPLPAPAESVPVPPTSAEENLQSAVSSIMPNVFKAKDKPINAPMPPVTPTLAMSVPQTTGSQDPNIKPLRTYESDFAEAMSHNKISRASIVIAEDKRKETEKTAETLRAIETPAEPPPPPSHLVKNLILTLLSIILVGGGVVSAYYLYSLSPLTTAVVSPQPITKQIFSTLVPVDSQVIIPIDNLLPAAIITRTKAELSKQQTPGTIKEIVFTKNGNVAVTSAEISKIMDIQAPDILLRSLTPSWLLGIYSNQNEQRSIFVVITNNFFQNAFAGMLQWESTMAEDFRQYLNIPSQTPESVYYSLRGQFVDRIIKNKDVREFVTNNGQIMFLYSFINNNTLIVTENEAVLTEIITRLEKQSFSR